VPKPTPIPEVIRKFFGTGMPEKIVVAVSGGPDSVGLLAAFAQMKIPTVIAAHVNHRLRGAASDADEMFVKDLAASLGLPFESVTADVAAASGGKNIEAVARRLRYDALVEIAARSGAALVATGHTADDQAETMMHRLIRGCGISGLAGILPRCKRGSVTIVRPLLCARRHDVAQYVGERSLSYRTDESNRDPRFTRNRIRIELMPALQKLNLRSVEHFCQLAELARQHRRIELAKAQRALAECELPRAGALCVFDRKKLSQISTTKARLLARLLWRREGWPRDGMGYREWIRLANYFQRSNSAIDLPGGIRARWLPRIIRIGPDA
jgi:tRNA(Ile)-lysidine synthase